ncbi:M4 family metallopeptidase [candidate division KSB1 bacterium]|nr:M4 family metallopeptidase [candidate division KSB1 bacterium]
MQKQRLRKLLALVIGIICVTPIVIGSTQWKSKAAANFQNVRGWQEKQNRKIGGAHHRLSQDELRKIGARLQSFALGKVQANPNGNTNRPSLGAALSRLREKPIDLAARLQQARQQRSWQRSIRWHESNGTPVFIAGSALRQPMAKLSSAAKAEEIALNIISANRETFRLDDPHSELKVVESFQDDFGKQHVKLAQWYQGVPVWGQDLVAHLEANGELYSVNARYSPTPKTINVNAANLGAEQAIQIARNNLTAQTSIEEFGELTQKILSYNGPRATKYILIDQKTQQPHLIWHVQIRSNLRDKWYYFIDASTGEILERYNDTNFDGPVTANATDLNGVTQTINVYQVGNTYYLIDASRPIWQTTQPDILNDPQGALWTIDARGKDLGRDTELFHVTSNNNTWNDRASVSAHSNVGRVFEYYYSTHGRRAIDDQNSTIISVIHVTDEGQPMDNAYWNGALMAYGDGNIALKPLAGGLDVAAHEMTHGVISRTVNLEYKFQSGALNESFADVFAVMVDRDDWLLGEDVALTSYFPSGALRNLQDPHNGGNSLNDNGWQPAHMNEFVDLTIDQDNGGVHINSGVPNRACYLIGNAIGRDKTESIYYRVLSARYLNTQSRFVDLRLAAIRAATDLYGDNSAEVNAAKAGFDGVGITDDGGTQPPGDLPPVQGDQWIAIVNAELADNSLYLARPVINNQSTDIVQLTPTQVYTNTGNPISVSDNGEVILFVDSNNFVRGINSDGSGETVISTDGVWSSIALSPDATKLAATSVFEDSTIYIFDLVDDNNSKAIHLYSPTTQQGVQADITVYADALDWDLNSQFVLYDAFNRIPQAGGGAIEYWDVNALDVDNELIFPLFPPQPEGINIGNPSFAQTNDNFFVFDVFDADQGTNEIWAIDVFSGEVGLIESNQSSIGYPRYSPDDSRIVFQREVGGQATLRQIAVAANKIESAGPSQAYVTGGQLPTWFAIGQRTDVEDKPASTPSTYTLLQNYPNPFWSEATSRFAGNPETTIRYAMPFNGQVSIAIYDIEGRLVTNLVSGTKTAGEHTLRWNGLDGAGNRVANGVYLYRMEATSPAGAVTRLTKKLMMVK